MENNRENLDIKKYLSTEELIDRLIKKKLFIKKTKIQETIKIIDKLGYTYVIRNYRTVFYDRELKQYYKGASFNQINAIMDFDISLKSKILEVVLHLECIIKNRFSEVLSKRNCNYEEYLDYKILDKEKSVVNSTLADIKREKKLNYDRVHNYEKSGYSIPPWGLMQMLTLNTVTRLYNSLNDNDQLTIAEYFQTDIKSMLSYLKNIKEARNIIVHLDPLYSFTSFNELSKKHYPVTQKYSNSKSFQTIIITLQKLCIDEESCKFNSLIDEINLLLFKLKQNVDQNFYDKIIRLMQLQDNNVGIKL